MNAIQQSQALHGLTYRELSLADQYTDEQFREIYMAPPVRSGNTPGALQGAPQSATEPCAGGMAGDGGDARPDSLEPPEWIGDSCKAIDRRVYG